MIKILVPQMACRVIDRAIQMFGMSSHRTNLSLARSYLDRSWRRLRGVSFGCLLRQCAHAKDR